MTPRTKTPQASTTPLRASTALLLVLLAFALWTAPAPAAGQPLVFLDAYFDGDVQGVKTLDGLNFVFATAVSPDGQNVYACSGNGGQISSDNAIAVFSRGAGGRLSFVEAHFDDDDSNDPGTADGLFACRDVAVSPDGKHVYTAAFSEGEVGIFDRDPATGALTFSAVVRDGVGPVDGLAGVESIALTTDGAFLFAVGSLDDAVTAFSRDGATGALTFEDRERNGFGGVSGLDRPVAVTVSPDGKHVYTAAGSNENFTGSDAVAVFAWDGAAGDLTFVASYFEGGTQGTHTIDGLHRLSSVTVSPDGNHVYATGGVDPFGDLDWIALFSRSAATGALTWVSSIGHSQICDLDITFGFETYAAVSPRGDRVLVTSPATAVVEFTRSPLSGALTFADAECFFDALGSGVDEGTNLPRRLSLDPTGNHLYVPGNASNAVAAFNTHGIFADGFESGDTSAWSSALP